MTINYDLTEEDLVDYQLHFARTIGHLKRSKQVMAILGAVLGILGILLFTIGKVAQGVGSLLYALFLFFFAPLMQKTMQQNLKKLVRKGYYKALLGSTQLTLTPKGIKTTNGMSESLMYWGAVEQLVESDTNFFVQFSAGVNLVIPKRAFATQTHGAQFLKMAEEYRQAATGVPIPTMQKGAWWTQGADLIETQSQRQ
ncbi:YcxB family protein [Armatimonas sp.]|uniref:YcxB family protein n=1 Tax=Armatimonas sp. TaxID=1872638 RepID=UPI0037537840